MLVRGRLVASAKASTSRLPPPPPCTCTLNRPISASSLITHLPRSAWYSTQPTSRASSSLKESLLGSWNGRIKGAGSGLAIVELGLGRESILNRIRRRHSTSSLRHPLSPTLPQALSPFLRSHFSSRSTISAFPPYPSTLIRRPFHSSPSTQFRPSNPRKDIFFVTVPAVKQVLLQVVRITLIFVPFAWRWGVFRRFPTASRSLWQIPLLAFCLVLALGLHQSPKTSRWRLLLMSEREELAWGAQRFDELIATESILILSPEDQRVAVVKDVCTRLLQALQDDSPISCANFPREEIVEKIRDRDKRRQIVPSATTDNVLMPFLPESSNPEKMLPSMAWDIFVVDLPKINAFVLPSTDIFVYTGLLSVTEGDENLLAACIAHEIIHVTERHSVESLGFLALSGVVFDILRGASWALTISFPMVGDAMAALFNFLDHQVGRRAYSRKLELEADALGLELMARAGFDPRGALTLWEILSEVEADVSETGEHGNITDHIALLRTHPTGAQRLEAIRELLPAAIKIYEKTRSGELNTRGANAVAVAKMQESDKEKEAEKKGTLKLV